jgi:hypothetical protein
MVLTLKRLMRLNFSQVHLTQGVTIVTFYVVPEEGRLLLDGFITESMNSFGYFLSIRLFYVLNFVAKIILILTYDLGSADETMNDFLFYVMWVVGLDIQIKSSMKRLQVQFRGQV